MLQLPEQFFRLAFRLSISSLSLLRQRDVQNALSFGVHGHGAFQSFQRVGKLVDQFLRRVASNRNHVRRSVSSIHTSMKLAVATSRCSSHTLCASRRRAAIVLLSSASSASMSNGSTYSASLSSTR